MTDPQAQSRRTFLKISSACAAHIAFMATPFPAAARALWAGRTLGSTVAQETFGRLESIGDGAWAFISTPLGGDYTTVCNGGIISGRSGVLVVEAFQTPEGARWIAEKARELTGSWPSHVLITHYHGDHSSGLDGFSSSGSPAVLTTETTRALKTEGFADDAPAAVRRQWADVVLVGAKEPESLDLGDRTVQLVPRRGHTPSDLSVELPEDGITWCGDLVWNGMFPNYMDAVPSQLSRAVRAMMGDRREIYVPGHGPLAGGRDFERYVAVINGLEETARTARREGWTAEEAGARHQIPEDLGEWTLFNPTYFQRAVEAWMKEWG